MVRQKGFPQTRVEERPDNITTRINEGSALRKWITSSGKYQKKRNFLDVAKSKFIELQEHWSSGDLAKLENFCTGDLMEHLSSEFKKEDRCILIFPW